MFSTLRSDAPQGDFAMNTRLSLSIQQIASHRWSRQKADGTTLEWEQEDESSVKCKADVVAMLQRTIDFWMPQLIHDMQNQKAMSLIDARLMAKQHFQITLSAMLSEPWTRRWDVKLEDFTFPIE
jgi:hypothetical protein